MMYGVLHQRSVLGVGAREYSGDGGRKLCPLTVKLLNTSLKWTTWTDSDSEAFGFSLCAVPTHNTQCLNLENCGLSLGCTQEQDRDETLGEAELIFKLEKRYKMMITIY